MKTKTKNKLKVIVAKSKKEHVRDVMLTYNWKQVKFITVKVEGNTYAAIRESTSMWKPSIAHSMLSSVVKDHPTLAKYTLVIFAVVKITSEEVDAKRAKLTNGTYGSYFGAYVSENQLTVLI